MESIGIAVVFILCGIALASTCLDFCFIRDAFRDKKQLSGDVIDKADPNAKEDHGIIGRYAEVQQDFTISHSNVYEGSVTLNGTTWKASCTSDHGIPLKTGEMAKVTSKKGIMLNVIPC